MLSSRELQQLDTITRLVDAIRRESRGWKKKKRRTAADAELMRAEAIAERKKGVTAATLARRYGVSAAYIYMITTRE